MKRRRDVTPELPGLFSRVPAHRVAPSDVAREKLEAEMAAELAEPVVLVQPFGAPDGGELQPRRFAELKKGDIVPAWRRVATLQLELDDYDVQLDLWADGMWSINVYAFRMVDILATAHYQPGGSPTGWTGRDKVDEAARARIAHAVVRAVDAYAEEAGRGAR